MVHKTVLAISAKTCRGNFRAADVCGVTQQFAKAAAVQRARAMLDDESGHTHSCLGAVSRRSVSMVMFAVQCVQLLLDALWHDVP